MTWTQRSNGLFPEVNRWWLTNSININDVDIVYQPIGAADLASSYVNLANPGTNDASPVVAPSFATATGWTFTGTEHLTTNLTGTGNKTIIVRCNYSDGTLRSITGYDTGSKAFYVERQTVGLGGDRYTWEYNSTSTSVSVFSPPPGDKVVCIARDQLYANGTLISTQGTLDTWSEGTITIANTIVAANRFNGEMSAYAIYNRQLTAAEVSEVTTNMLALTSADDPDPSANVNYIAIKPSTKRLNSLYHELLAATDTGIFKTTNGGRSWSPITLPDPSNAQFGDSPAATVDELNFHWVSYGKTSESTILVLGQKTSTNRQWLYRSTDDAENWSSRGIVTS